MLDALLDWFFPQTCYLCHDTCHHVLCDACIAALPYQSAGCLRCGQAYTRFCQICKKCLKHPPLFQHTYTAFRYHQPIEQLIHAAKYQHQFGILSLLAHLMAQHFRQLNIPYPDVLIPVPLHYKRQYSRGYNQSYELAKVLGQAFSLPVDYRSCKRVKNTFPQSRLQRRAERLQNIQEAFAYFPPYPAWQHIALVDDVFTTGATLNELSRILMAQGVKRVDVWCCARR